MYLCALYVAKTFYHIRHIAHIDKHIGIVKVKEPQLTKDIVECVPQKAVKNQDSSLLHRGRTFVYEYIDQHNYHDDVSI